MEKASDVHVNEIFGHQIQRTAWEVADNEGKPLNEGVGDTAARTHKRAQDYLKNTDPQAGIAHQFSSAEEAMNADRVAVDTARAHVAENLPAYVARGIEQAESTNGGNTPNPPQINIERQ